MFGASYAPRPNVTATASVASASVADLLRTETDPQSLGGEIPYSSTLVSLGVARSTRWVTLGVAARYRYGAADADRASTFATDVGAVFDHVAGTPVRFAASTFLFKPSTHNSDASYQLAADVPVFGIDTTAALRAGYAANFMGIRGREGYAFALGRYRQLDFSAGVAHANAFGNTELRWRFGAGLHYAGYTVAIGREDGGAGLGASYQVILKRVLP
jgi:hypothetical protein